MQQFEDVKIIHLKQILRGQTYLNFNKTDALIFYKLDSSYENSQIITFEIYLKG